MSRKETTGKQLKRVRMEQGLSVPQLVEKILRDHGETIGASTIRDVENDKTPNPGRNTVAKIARGLGLDPLEVLGLGLGNPPELDAGYTETQFAQLSRAYKQVRKDKKQVADDLVKMLIEQMERWR
jgi:transcriptional regulator with XRE-family HTH domain